MRTTHLLLTCTCILVFSQLARAQQTLSAEDILQRVGKVYAECDSYRDSGTATTIFNRLPFGTHTVKKPFTTAFVRPNRFRFEFNESQLFRSSRYIIWQNGGDVQTWWNLHHPNIRHVDGIQPAVAGATGVSSSSAFLIPALLMPDRIKGRGLMQMGDVHRIDDAAIDGVVMFRLRGSRMVDTTVWIEQATFLIRRIEYDPPNAHETIDYSPKMNVEIPAQLLVFRPR